MKPQRHVWMGIVLAGFVVNAAWAGPPAKVTPELIAKGKQLFAVNCVACHGEKGDGTGPAAAALNPKPRNFAKDPFKAGDKPEQIFKTISEGLKGTAMVAFLQIAEDDRWALAHYVGTFRKADAVSAAKTDAPQPAKPAKK